MSRDFYALSVERDVWKARAERAEARLAKVETALNELGDVYVYGERNSTYYCGAQTMAKRVRAALTPGDQT